MTTNRSFHRLGQFPRWTATATSLVASVATMAMPGLVMAQDPPPIVTAGTKVVVAGDQYTRPLGGTFLFGKDYRDLWATPIRVDVMDMAATGGGLTPTRTIGGNESRGLAFRGRDGRDYSFRPVKKDLRGILPA